MIRMYPIGYVESEYTDPKKLKIACKEGTKFAGESSVVLYEENVDMLEGLEQFSHAWILFHLHKADDRVEPVTHPGAGEMKLPQKGRSTASYPGRRRMPLVGVFASRSQYRPNHIALRLVRISEIKGNRMKVIGLDAVNDSPVLDIKPFVPHFDVADEPKVASWYEGWQDGR
ncbi:MAG: hypothetical protein DRO99_04845 [Candidatus Aenigmatarchaeota archaeon]|nr:MAG: hypothetical protein DRO99_04845 [Candidatus Aenigmarchaeota archaeon]